MARELSRINTPNIVGNWPVSKIEFEKIQLADEDKGNPVVAKRVNQGYRFDLCTSSSKDNCLVKCSKRNDCPVFERLQHS